MCCGGADPDRSVRWIGLPFRNSDALQGTACGKGKAHQGETQAAHCRGTRRGDCGYIPLIRDGPAPKSVPSGRGQAPPPLVAPEARARHPARASVGRAIRRPKARPGRPSACMAPSYATTSSGRVNAVVEVRCASIRCSTIFASVTFRHDQPTSLLTWTRVLVAPSNSKFAQKVISLRLRHRNHV